MTSEYKNFDPKRCKAKVSDGTGWQWFQCQRRPWRDGWCRQHHPDTVTERKRERAQRYEEKYQHSPEVQLDWAHQEIARLKARIAELKDALELACQYLAKAEIDGLMQGCAHPPQFALNKARIALAKVAGDVSGADIS